MFSQAAQPTAEGPDVSQFPFCGTSNVLLSMSAFTYEPKSFIDHFANEPFKKYFT